MKGRVSEKQIAGIPREHEAGAQTAEVCRRHGIGLDPVWLTVLGG